MSNFKLTFDEPVFYTKEERGKVTCKLKARLRIPDKWIFKARMIDDVCWGVYDTPSIDFEESNDLNKCMIVFNITTAARKAPEDTWNESVGKMIAETKAKRKAYKEASRLFEKFYKSIVGDLEDMGDFFAKMRACQNGEDEHLKLLCNGTLPIKKKKSKMSEKTLCKIM